MARVLVRPRARRDINEILVYYVETAGIEVARRFRRASTETFRELSQAPLMGAPRKVRKPEFTGVRMWRVTGVISVRQLAGLVTTQLGRPMIDKTGLAGYYDIDLTWNRPYVPPRLPWEPPAPAEAPTPEGSKTATLFPALEKQLGLKAEATKLAVDVLMIDSVERVPKAD